MGSAQVPFCDNCTDDMDACSHSSAGLARCEPEPAASSQHPTARKTAKRLTGGLVMLQNRQLKYSRIEETAK